MLLKKLINYSYDCIKETLKSSSFLNLKDENLIKPDAVSFENKKLKKMLISYEKNKLNQNILMGKFFIKKNNIYSPLIYADIEINQNYEIKYISDFDLNINLLINLLNANEADFIINTLLNTEDERKAEVLTALTGIKTEKEEIIIFSCLPDAIAGLLNELKTISKSL